MRVCVNKVLLNIAFFLWIFNQKFMSVNEKTVFFFIIRKANVYENLPNLVELVF